MRNVEVFVRPKKGQDALKRAMVDNLSKCMLEAERYDEQNANKMDEEKEKRVGEKEVMKCGCLLWEFGRAVMTLVRLVTAGVSHD